MTLPNNPNKLERFIHKCFHEIAKDEEMKDIWRDRVNIIMTKWEWEDFKDEIIQRD